MPDWVEHREAALHADGSEQVQTRVVAEDHEEEDVAQPGVIVQVEAVHQLEDARAEKDHQVGNGQMQKVDGERLPLDAEDEKQYQESVPSDSGDTDEQGKVDMAVLSFSL